MIDTLSAGLSVMARHVWLLILPIAIDLFLWLAPPLAIGKTLLQTALPPLNIQSLLAGSPDPEIATQAQTMYDGFSQQLALTNFWGWVVPSGLFLPSVMVGAGSTPTDVFWSLDTPLTFFSAFIGLTLLGVLANVSWLHAIAFAITQNAAMLKTSAILRSFLNVIGLGLLILLIVVGTIFAASLFLAVITLLLPGLGGILSTLILLFAVWWVVWIGVQLYFTIAALIMERQGVFAAPNASATLLRRHPDNPHWRSGYGFIFISVILSWGFAFIWQSLMPNPVGRLVGIVGNAALGTGITAAMMLFYYQRTHPIQSTKEQPITI